MAFLDYPCSNCGALVFAGQIHGCMNEAGSRGSQAGAPVQTSQVYQASVAEVAAELTSDNKTKNFRGVPLQSQGQGNVGSP